jgi:hypothetical protein
LFLKVDYLTYRNSTCDISTIVSETNTHTYIEVNRRLRTCRFCALIKPERTHHCRHCRKCIRRLDHHCFFINTCVGLYNHKYFIVFLFYLNFFLLFFIATILPGIRYCFLQFGIHSIPFIAISLSLFISIIVFSSVLFLFIIQLYMMSNNVTTIEKNEPYKQNKDKEVYF